MNTVNGSSEAPSSDRRRVLLIDDHPELRVLMRARVGIESDIEVVGEGSNGAEAVALARVLAPSAVILDDDMPVMGGAEAIPLLRAAAPGMGILLYSASDQVTLTADGKPDGVVRKGARLNEVVQALRRVLDMTPFDVLRLQLPAMPLDLAITAFDTWIGLNARIPHDLHATTPLTHGQMGGTSAAELGALTTVYAHIGHNIQKAARQGAHDVSPVIHVFRSTGVLAHQALRALSEERMPAFWAAWQYEVPADAVAALSAMHARLLQVLPSGPSGDGALQAIPAHELVPAAEEPGATRTTTG